MRGFLRARRGLWWVVLLIGVWAGSSMRPAMAMSNYVVGHITTIAVNNATAGTPDGILVQVDSGLPTNCSGTLFGWMWVPSTSTVLTAYVLGLWLSGNAPSVSVTVYTSGLSTDNFCQITQIQPAS